MTIDLRLRSDREKKFCGQILFVYEIRVGIPIDPNASAVFLRRYSFFSQRERVFVSKKRISGCSLNMYNLATRLRDFILLFHNTRCKTSSPINIPDDITRPIVLLGESIQPLILFDT